MLPKPILLLTLPAIEDLFGNGILSAKCDEDNGTRLRPMRTAVFVNQQLRFRIKELSQH